MNAEITEPKEAKRLARVIVSDILAYNKEKVEKGIAEDSIFELLKDELEEAEVYYRSKISKSLYEDEAFLDLAIVDLLIKTRGYLESKIW